MPVSPALASNINTIHFTDASDIDAYFIKSGGQDFVSWFNAHAANKDNWGKVGIRSGLMIANDSYAHNRFNELWSNESIEAMFGTDTITLLQFLALQSIIINETGGSLIPLTEAVGSNGHPGIAYAFDNIPGLKRSYNTLFSNKTCFQNFNDPNFNKTFGALPMAEKLINTTDKTWAGQVYPLQAYPTSTNPALSGYILEGDFFKFRGRGFIQTTSRTNYTKLITYVVNYKGGNSLLQTIKDQWNNTAMDVDVLASMSSNADWDDLFQKSNCLVAGRAIYIHNESCGNYLQQLNSNTVETMEQSLFNMGLKISGGTNYADLFRDRVLQIVNLL